jgi:hypothetical protein
MWMQCWDCRCREGSWSGKKLPQDNRYLLDNSRGLSYLKSSTFQLHMARWVHLVRLQDTFGLLDNDSNLPGSCHLRMGYSNRSGMRLECSLLFQPDNSNLQGT